MERLAWASSLTSLGFLFALGAIVGSFLNVLVYRLPLGKGIVTPPSACPHCDTKLRWKDNIPILGWFLLRGRCRYCKSRISPEYFIVELLVAILFAWVGAAWFLKPTPLTLIGLDPTYLKPEWAFDGLHRMWPMLAQIYILFSVLVAITLIDARTFTIPLLLPWTATVVGFVVHPLHAAWIGWRYHGLRTDPHTWTIPTPTGAILIATFASMIGLVISISLLKAKIIPQSFADFEEWEREAQARADRHSLDVASGSVPPPPPPNDRALAPTFRRVFLLTGPALALMFLGFSLGMPSGHPFLWMFAGMGAGLVIGMVLRRTAIGASGNASDSPDAVDPIWLSYPHARREMIKELAFLVLPTAAFAIAWYLAHRSGIPPMAADPPLWISALAGSFLGYLVGGGVVWCIRIFGSLGFGKEAIGLGDVHLMAGVGAVLGWIDPTIAFFVAPALGLSWVIGSWAVARARGKSVGSALPFGPHLAMASVLVVLAKPVVESILALILSRPINLP